MARDLDVVRHELCIRIAGLDGRAPRAQSADLAAGIEEIRAIAIAARLDAAVTVIRFLAAALARGERGSVVRDGLHMLADAVGCDRQDRATCAAFAAACSVRLAA